jgi:hypothetical protein
MCMWVLKGDKERGRENNALSLQSRWESETERENYPFERVS